MDMASTRVPFSIESEYILKNFEKSSQKRVYLILHGYLQSADIIDKLTRNLKLKGGVYLIPNGPFFVPYKKNNKQYYGYSWYFYDVENDKYLVNYTAGTEYLSNFLRAQELINNPLTILGYSQGGYMGLQLAKSLPNCDHLICLNAKAKAKYVDGPYHFKIDLVNGEDDLIIPLSGVEEEFNKIRTTGQKISLHKVYNSGHKINHNLISVVNGLI